MSTKSTIISGDNFHLYSEMMDEDNVWLELEGVYFEASSGSITVAIPAAIWQSIRRHKVDMQYIDQSDEQIRAAATDHVDSEHRKYEEHLSRCKHCATRKAEESACFMLYGMLDAREDRINEIVAYRIADRARQQRIRTEMECHRAGGLHLINLADGTSERVTTVELES